MLKIHWCYERSRTDKTQNHRHIQTDPHAHTVCSQPDHTFSPFQYDWLEQPSLTNTQSEGTQRTHTKTYTQTDTHTDRHSVTHSHKIYHTHSLSLSLTRSVRDLALVKKKLTFSASPVFVTCWWKTRILVWRFGLIHYDISGEKCDILGWLWHTGLVRHTAVLQVLSLMIFLCRLVGPESLKSAASSQPITTLQTKTTKLASQSHRIDFISITS